MKKLEQDDRVKLALHLGISQNMAKVLVSLFNETMLEYADFPTEFGTSAHHRTIFRLRAVVAPHGVEINTQYGTGYWMDNTSREVVLQLLRTANAVTAGGKE